MDICNHHLHPHSYFLLFDWKYVYEKGETTWQQSVKTGKFIWSKLEECKFEKNDLKYPLNRSTEFHGTYSMASAALKGVQSFPAFYVVTFETHTYVNLWVM